MKRKLMSGLIVAAFAVAVAIPAFAAGVLTIQVEPDVKVYVNDTPIDAGDTHGNPEAFIHNGTTYIAAAAVSKSLGENVKWDGKSRSVYIGKHIGSSYYLMDVCPPYQVAASFNKMDSVTMAGKKYASAISLHGGYVLFNLNGKYNTLSFDLGHIDGRSVKEDDILTIYLDGEQVFSVKPNAEDFPSHYEIPLNGALQMKMTVSNGWFTWPFALANLQVS